MNKKHNPDDGFTSITLDKEILNGFVDSNWC